MACSSGAGRYHGRHVATRASRGAQTDGGFFELDLSLRCAEGRIMSFTRTTGGGAVLVALVVLRAGCTPLKTYLPIPDADHLDTGAPATDGAVDRADVRAGDASDARDASTVADTSLQGDVAPDP